MTSTFHKRDQFPERLCNTKFKLWWIKKNASIIPKGWHYFFQVSVNLNVLKHYYQRIAAIFSQIQYTFEKQTLRYQFSADTCSFHFSNFSSMNGEGRENSNIQKCFIRHYPQVPSQAYSSVMTGRLHGMRKRWFLPVFCQGLCYIVLPQPGNGTLLHNVTYPAQCTVLVFPYYSSLSSLCPLWIIIPREGMNNQTLRPWVFRGVPQWLGEPSSSVASRGTVVRRVQGGTFSPFLILTLPMPEIPLILIIMRTVGSPCIH